MPKKLSSLEAVAKGYETHTYGDLLHKMRAKSPSELGDVISSDIKGVSGVVGIQVVSVLNVWKDSR